MSSPAPPRTEPPPLARPAGAPARAPARGSLSALLVAIVMGVNLAVFLVVGVVTVETVREERASALRRTDDFAMGLVADILDERSNIRAQWLLDLSYWSYVPFDDVFVAQAPERDAHGRLSVQGVFVNPEGRARRPSTFDEQGMLEGVLEAVRTGERVELADDSVAIPISLPDGSRWGACWYRPHERGGVAAAVMARTLPWFALSILGATLVTLLTVRRLVLDPVRDLADAASRVERGDLAARVREPERNTEMAALARGFNAMAARVEYFNAELEREVAAAIEQARRAETAAMTQRRLAATGELAAGIAHEINNPLGGMLNAIESLQGGELSPARREQYLTLVQNGLERVRQIVGRLLRLAPRGAEVGSLSLAGPLADALGLVLHRASRLGVRIVLTDAHGREREATQPDATALFADLPRIRGAANELGQAILNVLVNSLDALEERRGGEVRISLVDASDVQRLTIEDDGPGVDAETLGRAADAFFTTKEQGRGTGLGLSIVHNVVHTHGGRVYLWSREGEGFRVVIELPTGGAGQAGAGAAEGREP